MTNQHKDECDWCGETYPNENLNNETQAGDAICDKCAAGARKSKRPYAQPNAQRRSIYTDDETWAKLLKLGNGNASAGIREAVRRTEEQQP